ncbi:MAG: hypothetical protein J6S52_02415 [Prevotella sp.]|nr:hypothetical protein [Prevotella sp.]
MKSNNFQPALIRAFFSAYTEGVLATDADMQEEVVELTPQRVKQIMLEHYEEISKHFFDILFNPLALLHYDTAEELISILRSPEVAPTLKSPVDLFRHVCRTEQNHEDMVAEYRRNFTSLLSGRVLSLDDFYAGFPEGYLDSVEGNQELAVRILTQTVVNAFFAGRKAALAKKTGNKAIQQGGTNQIYLFRLLVENMQCLLHSKPVLFDDDADLNEMFRIVCVTPENMNTMLTTMQQTLTTINNQ